MSRIATERRELALPMHVSLLEITPGSLGGHAGPDMTRYVVVCAVLLLLVAGLGWGFRRLLGRTLATRAARRSLSVMDVLPMGGKQKLAVVRCYDRTFLLGLGEREVSLVAELDPVLAPEREASATVAERSTFAELLARVKPAVGKWRASERGRGTQVEQPNGETQAGTVPGTGRADASGARHLRMEVLG